MSLLISQSHLLKLYIWPCSSPHLSNSIIFSMHLATSLPWTMSLLIFLDSFLTHLNPAHCAPRSSWLHMSKLFSPLDLTCCHLFCLGCSCLFIERKVWLLISGLTLNVILERPSLITPSTGSLSIFFHGTVTIWNYCKCYFLITHLLPSYESKLQDDLVDRKTTTDPSKDIGSQFFTWNSWSQKYFRIWYFSEIIPILERGHDAYTILYYVALPSRSRTISHNQTY